MPAVDPNLADVERARRARRVMGYALAIIIFLLLIVSTVIFWMSKPVGRIANSDEARGLVWVRSIYGWGEAETDQLMTPNDVAIAPNGTIWVTDQARARIIGFNPDGSYKALLHQGPVGSSPFSLEMATSVAVDEEGLIYVGSLTADRITVLDEDNKVLRQYAVPEVSDIAVRGDLMVAGSTAGFVIMNTDGDVQKVVGTKGKGKDQFDKVAGVTIGADNTIYVVDQFNNRVSAWDASGTRKWVRQTGPANNDGITDPMKAEEATVAPTTLLPARITLDGAGRLVVADPFNFALTVLDPKDGSFIASYGAMGSADGMFTYPNGVDYDAQRDWFAVADSANSRVQIVQLPNSGGDAAASVWRGLSGPLRALLLPLIVLLVAILMGVIARVVKKIREKRQQAAVLETA